MVKKFVEIRPFVGSEGKSGIENLLEGVNDAEIAEAISLVNGKVMIYPFNGMCT